LAISNLRGCGYREKVIQLQNAALVTIEQTGMGLITERVLRGETYQGPNPVSGTPCTPAITPAV